jgi:hypothetical protein
MTTSLDAACAHTAETEHMEQKRTANPIKAQRKAKLRIKLKSFVRTRQIIGR